MENQEGIKYGLGSSAAVIVATVEVLCRHYGISISKMELFKLSALANLAVNNRGSCGDIGASVYGGWISFKTFDRGWILEKKGSWPITQLLGEEWPKLSIEILTAPQNLKLLVGWTKKPATTSNLVKSVDYIKKKNNRFYKNFLHNSYRCVSNIIHAFNQDNILEIQRQIQINRNILLRMGNELGITIETPLLTSLCNIALKFNGSAKPSGAGGGDCGIVILKNSSYTSQLIDEWEKAGISYLPLNVYKYD